jgi:hypothetical protein
MVDEWLVFTVLFHPFNGEFMVILILLIINGNHEFMISSGNIAMKVI